MIIETKFNVDNYIFIIEEYKIKQGVITCIQTQIIKGDIHTYITYSVKTNTGLMFLSEDKLFKTKEELIASL